MPISRQLITLLQSAKHGRVFDEMFRVDKILPQIRMLRPGAAQYLRILNLRILRFRNLRMVENLESVPNDLMVWEEVGS